MYTLELNRELTEIHFITASNEMEILSELEDALAVEYPEQSPYGCYDVEILSRQDCMIEINIIHESGLSGHMEKSYAILRKV